MPGITALSRAVLTLALLSSGCGACSGDGETNAPRVVATPEAPDAAAPVEGPALVLRPNSLADYYYTLRALSQRGEGPRGLEPALDAMQVLRDDLRATPQRFELLEGPLRDATRPAQLVAAYRELPATLDGIPLRAHALELARAMARCQPTFIRLYGQAHAHTLDAARDELDHLLEARGRVLLGYAAERLALPVSSGDITIQLIADGPFPGIHMGAGDTEASYVRVDSVAPNALDGLLETIVHEALHALDDRTRDQATAFDALRQGLSASGIGESTQPDLETVVNALVFVQGADAVRRYVDPDHVPNGDTTGFYAATSRTSEVVRGEWAAYLSGAATRATALTAIAERVVPD